MKEQTKKDYFSKLTKSLKGSGVKMITVYESETYAHFSDGKNIIYIQVSDMPWQYEVSAEYIPSRDFGTGCRIAEFDLDIDPNEIPAKIEILLNAGLPGWLRKNGRWPKMWDDIDHFVEYKEKTKSRPVLVTL